MSSLPPSIHQISIRPTSSVPYTSSRISLHSPALTDAPSLLARAQNPTITQYIPGLRFAKPTLEGYEKLIKDWNLQSRQRQSRTLIIVLEATGESVGDAGYESLHRLVHGKEKIFTSSSSEQTPVLQVGEAGIMLDSHPSTRGKGYALEALSMVFDYGFEVLGLDEVRVRTMEINMAMRGIMERKFGFNKAEDAEWVKQKVTEDTSGLGMGGDWEGVAQSRLGRVERYWKVMSDRVDEGERECAMCYCIEREKWKQWKHEQEKPTGTMLL